jgi:hypothetical protein
MTNPIKSQIAANRERFEKELKEKYIDFCRGTTDKEVYADENLDFWLPQISKVNTTSQTSLLQTAIAAVEGLRTKPNIMGYLSDKAKGSNKTISKVVELLKGGIEN